MARHEGQGAVNEVGRQEGCLSGSCQDLESPLNGKVSLAAASGMGLIDSSERTEAAQSKEGGTWGMRLW